MVETKSAHAAAAGPQPPRTKLPYFNTTVPASCATPPRHCATISACAVAPGDADADADAENNADHHLLRRFALFVAAVAETDAAEQVSFVQLASTAAAAAVDLNGGKKTTTTKATITTAAAATLVRATISSRTEVTALQQTPLVADAELSAYSDFCLRIGAAAGHGDTRTGTGTDMSQPLVVSVARTGSHDGLVDITLSLRGDYGPAVAAEHLLRLAVSRICPAADGPGPEPGPEPSRINLSSVSQIPPSCQARQTTTLAAAAAADAPQLPLLLHAAFEEHARLHPSSLVTDYLSRGGPPSSSSPSYVHQDLTYAEMDAKADALADELGLMIHTLKWKPIWGEQRVVPIMLPACPELLIGMLGALKAGQAFCSLPLDAPEDRIRHLLDDLQAPAVLGVGKSPLAAGAAETVWVDLADPTSWRTAAASPPPNNDYGVPVPVSVPVVPPPASDNGRRTPSEDDVAYVLYTSGSTGKPKGVLVSHRSVVCAVDSFAARMPSLPAGPRLRWFAMCSPTFDVFLLETFLTLTLGGTLCVAERDLMLTDVEAAVRELRACATFAVSSLAMLLRPAQMPTLKTLVVGGELVNQRVIDTFAPPPPQGSGGGGDERTFVNLYGPTEAAILVTTEHCTVQTRGTVIGDPLPTVSAVILDPEAAEPREVPLGVAGELAVGGPQVSLGYLNRPKESAKAFVTSPELGRLYRTGDKARIVWTEDGRPKIDYLGRLGTDQVKLNGRRVELPEIEAVVSRVESVAEAAVVVVQGTKLVAFVVPWPGAGAAAAADMEAQCRAEADRSLPAWMRPTHYVALERLPRSPSKKVDRKQLATMMVSEEFTAPTTKIATPACQPPSIAASISSPSGTAGPISGAKITKANGTRSGDVSSTVYHGLVAALGNHMMDVPASTPLFSLGLDSLRAMVFLQSVREEGINDLTIHDMLSATTIQSVIGLVEDRQKAAKAEPPEWTNGSGAAPAAGPDVTLVARDDEEALYDLPVEAKLRHFDHHCRAECAEALRIPTADLAEVMPATNLQVRILAITTKATFSDPERYVGRPQIEHFVYRVPTEMDPARLQRAVAAVVARYDCFRTVFTRVNHPLAPFAQCVLSPAAKSAATPTVEIVCNVTDGYDTADSLWQHTISGAQRAAEASMSMERPGIVLSYVWSRDRARCVLVFSLSHVVYDGVTLAHFRNAIAAEYACAGAEPPLALLPMRRAVELLVGSDWLTTTMYWMSRFAGVPPFQLGSHRPGSGSNTQTATPTPKPEPKPRATSAAVFTGSSETHMRSLAILSRLSMDELAERAASALSTTPLAVVQAAWASVLAQTQRPAGTANGSAAGVLDVQFGSVLHGRHDDVALRCMAPMLATVPQHLVLDDSRPPRTNREICRELAAQHAEATPHIQVPCPTLDLADMAMSRFDTTLIVQAYRSPDDGGRQAADLPGFFHAEGNLSAPYKEMDIGFPILMELWPGRGSSWAEPMLLKCTYNARRPGYEFLTQDWVHGLVGAMDEALSRILARPDDLFSIRPAAA